MINPKIKKARQDKLIAFLRSYMKREGWSPSYREIAKHIYGRDSNTIGVYKLMQELEKNGIIKPINGKNRNIEFRG